MNLVPKLSLTFIAGVSVILAVNGLLRVRREVGLFETDRIRDDVQVADALGDAMTTVWQRDGEAGAMAVVAHADAHEGRLRVHWVWLDDDLPGPLRARRAELAAIARDDALSFVDEVDKAKGEQRFTVVPVSTPSPRRGALVVSDPMEAERAYIRRTILDTVVTTLTLDGVCAVLAMLVGAWIVGRPMSALEGKARRVGGGDFGTPLQFRQKDEISRLATEMNAMCERLVMAQERTAMEMRARVEMLEQLRHADRLMTVGKLASGIAHELGTPLNIIEARASMIASGETTPEESVTCARAVIRGAERMTRIIRQLLAFARPGTLEKCRCDLVAVVQRAVELLQPLAEKRGVVVRVDAAGPVYSDADAGQIEQAITNLVMNATQAMDHAGTVSLTVDHALEAPPTEQGAAAQHARIRVRDEGKGIPVDNLPRLFEPFFTTKDVGEGTGLGLAVTYGIVREHGGWIGVASELGRGSTFTVHLPLVATSLEAP